MALEQDCVDSQKIQHEMMKAASQYIEKEHVGGVGENELIQAMTRLKEFSFVSMRRIDDGRRYYEVHKLVQEATRYGLSVKSRDDMADVKAKQVLTEARWRYEREGGN